MIIANKTLRLIAWTSAVALFAPATLWAGNAAVPHTFVASTPARASEVNENFSAVTAAINKTSAIQLVSSSANLTASGMTIDHPAANGNANALVYATRLHGTGHSTEWIPSSFSVAYDATSQRWAILREDKGAIPAGVAFNVLIVNP